MDTPGDWARGGGYKVPSWLLGGKASCRAKGPGSPPALKVANAQTSLAMSERLSQSEWLVAIARFAMSSIICSSRRPALAHAHAGHRPPG